VEKKKGESIFKTLYVVWVWWLLSVILAMQEAVGGLLSKAGCLGVWGQALKTIQKKNK
jgi:hypothetical protein